MNKNDIRLLTCNNLFITYYTIKKKIKPPSWNRRKRWQNCKAILPAKFGARRQPKSKIKRATQLVQLNYYNLFDWTIQTPKWYDIISLVKWYHITSWVSFLFTALSHWYPHIICNKMEFRFLKAFDIVRYGVVHIHSIST